MGRNPWRPPQSQLPGRYAAITLKEYLGEGGFGVVYKAESVDLPGQDLAVKFLFFPEDQQAAFLALLRQEAAAALTVESRFLVRTHHTLDLREYPPWPPVGLVMDYYPLSLARVIADCENERRLNADQVALWLQQIALGLHEFHIGLNLVHRDVKCENILFERSGRYYGPGRLTTARARVSDFGIVHPRSQEPPFPVLQDKRGTKAPELFDDAGRPRKWPADPAEDVFSFGVLLRELAAVTQEPITWLVELAGRCCEKEPSRRPSIPDLLPSLSPVAGSFGKALDEAGWSDRTKHRHFVGRGAVRAELDAFVGRCERADHGGVFLVTGPSGIGKSALLYNWASHGRPWPGFYFNHRTNKYVRKMPGLLHTQLKSACNFDYDPPAADSWQANDLKNLFGGFVAAHPAQHLRVFIDALDEADDPKGAADLIPAEPPKGVFLIVASRPSAHETVDHLGALTRHPRASVHCIELSPDSQDTRDALTLYFEQQLKAWRPRPGQIQALVEATGGIFRLGTLLVQSIYQDPHPDTAIERMLQRSRNWADLPAGQEMFGFYQDDLERVFSQHAKEKGEDLRPYWQDFARLMVVAEDWVSEDEIQEMLVFGAPTTVQWDEVGDRRDRILRAFNWFLAAEKQERDFWLGPSEVERKKVTCYQLQHASVGDFLQWEKGSYKGPARDPKIRSDMHARIGVGYLQRASEGWRRVSQYGRFHTVRHLLTAGNNKCFRQAATLLCDLDYLQATLGDEPPEMPRTQRGIDESGGV